MEKLKRILDSRGCGAIMQYGGAGKTQLMTASGERAENQGWIPGGSYWVGAHGNREQFISALANFVDAVVGTPMKEEDRKMLALRRKLDRNAERWLLCVDNADSSEVNEIVGELCSISMNDSKKGWVLVTSRQSATPIWFGMVSEQKLLLQPLSVTHAMGALLRFKNERLKRNFDDEQIKLEVQAMQLENPDEYQSLLGLSDSSHPHGHGGLPLALARAGSFIVRNKFSFIEYVEFYKSECLSDSVADVFLKVEETGLSLPHQRTFWTT